MATVHRINNLREKAELLECIQVIDYNLTNVLYNRAEQVELKREHLARIDELDAMVEQS